MSGSSSSFSGRLARFASFNVAQHVWLAAVSLVATPILYHRLGEAAYGLLSVVNLAAAQLSVLEFGFGHATIRRLSQNRATGDVDGMSRTLATSSWVFLCTALVGALAILASADVLAERYFQIPAELLDTGKAALRIGAAFFAVSMLGNLASSVWQGLQRFGYLNLVSALGATLQLLGSIALVLAGFGVLHVVGWTVVLGGVTLLVQFAWLRRTEPGVRPFGRPDRVAFGEMARFGFLLMLAGVFTQVFFSGGALVLGHYVLVGALPFFTVPFGLYQRLNRMGYGLASALYPLVAELDGLQDRQSLQRIFLSGTRMLLLVGAAAMAPAVLVATPFLTVWMGPEFAAQGGPVLQIMFVVFGISLATTPSVELARGRGQAGWLVAYAGLLALVNVAAVAILAPRWGPLGAAMGFLIAQVAGTAFLLLRVGGSSCFRLASYRVLVILAAAGWVTVEGLSRTDVPGARLALACVVGLTVAGAGWAWGLTDEERTLLRRMAART